MNIEALAAPFPPDVVSWRVGPTNKDKTKGMALAYIDARDVQDRLTEVCGPFGWQCRHEVSGDKRVTCHIGIKCPETAEWIWRSDGAGETDVDGEKGSYSDSFKRAAVKWGIGRYLYDLGSPWVAIEAHGRSYSITAGEMKRLAGMLGKQMPAQHKPPIADRSPAFLSFVADLDLCKTGDDLSNWAVRIKTAHGKGTINDDEMDALRHAYVEHKHDIEAKREAA
jgi:hypothetical protein